MLAFPAMLAFNLDIYIHQIIYLMKSCLSRISLCTGYQTSIWLVLDQLLACRKRICHISLAYVVFTSLACADYVEVTLLGTGTPRPSIERFGSATLIEAGGQYFLFDAGRGATIRLQQAGITPNQIQKVFLTHLHSDHISGLDDLWITGWIYQREGDLTVHGPLGTQNMIDSMRTMYREDIGYRTANVGHEDAYLQGVEVTSGVVFEDSLVKITAFEVSHQPVEPALAYRLDFGKRSVVISGDTTYSSNLVNHAKNVDVLIHEITDARTELIKRNPRLSKIMAYHTTPQQLAQVLNKTRPRLAVMNHVLLFGVSEASVLNKIQQGYQGRVQFGADLMRIQVGENINILTP